MHPCGVSALRGPLTFMTGGAVELEGHVEVPQKTADLLSVALAVEKDGLSPSCPRGPSCRSGARRTRRARAGRPG